MNDADHLPDDTAIRALAENGMHETRTRRRRCTTGLVTARQQAVQWVDGRFDRAIWDFTSPGLVRLPSKTLRDRGHAFSAG
jgi:hypothetical protein